MSACIVFLVIIIIVLFPCDNNYGVQSSLLQTKSY